MAPLALEMGVRPSQSVRGAAYGIRSERKRQVQTVLHEFDTEATAGALGPTALHPLARAAWWPVPIFCVAILLLWVADLHGSYELPRLLTALNFVFSTLAGLTVAYLVAVSFVASGRPGLLLLGAGVLVWGIASLVASTFAARSANTMVTIHNLGVWVLAVCQLAAAACFLRPRLVLRASHLWLGAGYTSALALAGLIVLCATEGWTPAFFVQDQGGTPLRQVVLLSAIAMLAAASLLMLQARGRSRSPFAWWYSLGLLLLAAGLAGVALQFSAGCPLGWTGRAAQNLGGAYMLVAAVMAVRNSLACEVLLVEKLEEARQQCDLERTRGEAGLRRSVRRFELLATTSAELLQTREPQRLVESLCRKVMDHLDCHAFFNFLVDPAAGKLRLNACAGIPPEEAERIEWLDYGAAVCGCAARDGCRIVAEHIPSTPDPRTDLVKSYGIKAYACHPLLGPGGKVIGTLSFGTRSRETFDDDDLSLMKAVTDQVAVAMVRIRDERQLREWNQTLEQRVAERTAEAEHRAVQLRALAAQLSQAEQRERKRIAQLLHDHLQQLLVGAMFDLGAVRSRLDGQPLGRDLDRVTSVLNEAVEASRSLAVELSPPILHDAGLAGGLAWLARWMQDKHGLPVEVRADGDIEPPDEDIRTVLFTAVQELLFNVVKHARARRAWIEATRPDPARVCIRVRDDGIGFEPRLARRQDRLSGGFGLFSIRERLEHLGGSLEIDSSPGAGTCARLRVPIDEAGRGAKP